MSLQNKCPVCRSTDLSTPDELMPPLYSMKPAKCNVCHAEFEANIIFRVGLWVFVTMLFSLNFLDRHLIATYGKGIAPVIVFLLLAFTVLTIIAGAIMETVKPWQLTLWDKRNYRRAFINYGSILSFAVYAIVFYSFKSSV